MYYCEKCGNPVSDLNAECSKCADRNKKNLIVVIVIVLVMIVGIGGFFVIKSISGEKNISPISRDEVLKEGYLQYLGKDKEYVLNTFPDNEACGEFEGADFYIVDGDAFAFSFTTDKCISVSCDFLEAFPGVIMDSRKVMSKEEFEEFIGYQSELITDEEYSDREVPFLDIYKNEFYILVSCDEKGNITNNSWCEVVVKETPDAVN